MRKLSHEEIVSRQVQKSREPRIPLVVILDNIRSLHNVGSIFRTADGIGVKKIYLCGITGYPPQAEIAKTALGAEEIVPWEYKRDAVSLVTSLKSEGYEVVMLEQAEGAVLCEFYVPRKPVALIIGNEIEGVDEKLAAFCDGAIEIEMAGVKNSLNVSVAFGVAGFQLRQVMRRSCATSLTSSGM